MRRRHFALLARPLAAALLGLVVACFDAPSATVMFTCDVASEPACPAGYTCQSDGCCHADGSDVAAHAGECMLGGATDVSATASGSGTAGSSSGSGSGSSSGSGTGSSSGTGSASGTSSGSESGSGSGSESSSSDGGGASSSDGGSAGSSSGTAGSSGSTSI